MESNDDLTEVQRLTDATRKQGRKAPRWYWPAIVIGAAIFLGLYALELPGYAGYGPALWAAFVAILVARMQRANRVVPRAFKRRRG